MEKVEVGVFDETAHGLLILWGALALAVCAANWQPSNTSTSLCHQHLEIYRIILIMG